MESPDITVVVPTRDRLPFLLTTMVSLRAQQGVALEVVVVDDGSIDGTAEALTNLGDPRVRVLSNARSFGVAEARNRGIAESDGEWVAFCDDDDLWSPTKLQRQLDAARTSDAAWVYGGAVGFDPYGEILWQSKPPRVETVLRRLAKRNVIPGGCSNVVVRRELLSRTGSFDQRLRTLADWELWLRLARNAVPAAVNEPLVGYRLHGDNMSADPTGLLEEFRLIEAATLDLRDGAPIDPAWLHRWLGQAALRAGERRTAAAAYFRAAHWRQPLSFRWALGALLGPRPASAAARRQRESLVWGSRAREWLDPLLSDGGVLTLESSPGTVAPKLGSVDTLRRP